MSNLEEILDVVDQDNHVISQEPRRTIHRDALFHRAVNILVVNSKNQLFLQQRSENTVTFPLFWDLSAAEHVKTGETFRVAAQRGLREELGLEGEVALIRSLHLQDNSFEKNGQIVWERELVELFMVKTDQKIHLDPEEVHTGEFKSIEEINQMLTDPSVKFTPWFLDEWKFVTEQNFQPFS